MKVEQPPAPPDERTDQQKLLDMLVAEMGVVLYVDHWERTMLREIITRWQRLARQAREENSS